MDILIKSLSTDNPASFIIIVLSVICVGLWRLWSFSIDRNKELQTDITERDNNLQSLRDEFFDERQTNLEKIVRLDTQINELVVQINRLNESDLAQRQLNIDLKKTIDAIRSEFESYRIDAIGKRDELERKVSSLQRLLNDERLAKGRLEDELSAEQSNREQLQQQILVKQSEIEAQRGNLMTVRDNNIKLTQENKLLVDQLNTVAERMARYESDVDALNKRIDRLTTTIEQLVSNAVNTDGDKDNPTQLDKEDK